MKINVKHVAKLANLELTKQEIGKFEKQLSSILDYIKKLDEVDTTNVKPTFNVTGQENVFRKDEAGKSLSQEEALKNASEKKDGFFVTKGVFEK